MKRCSNITIKPVKAVDNLYSLKVFCVRNTALYIKRSLMDEKMKSNQRPQNSFRADVEGQFSPMFKKRTS
jgi:hypothetical protein